MSRHLQSLSHTGGQCKRNDKTHAPDKRMEAQVSRFNIEDDIDMAPKECGNCDVIHQLFQKIIRHCSSYRDTGYKVIKRSDVLQLIHRHSFNICIRRLRMVKQRHY